MSTTDGGGNELDGGGGDLSLAKATSSQLCGACIAQRCSSTAQACYADATCASAESCVASCSSQACLQGCSSDMTVLSNASELETCESSMCYELCVATPPLAPSTQCASLGSGCDPLAVSCCDGLSCPQNGGACCIPENGACTDGGCCPIGGNPAMCDPSSHTCKAQTCTQATGPDASGCSPTLPCCDTRLSCVDEGPVTGMMCCAKGGTQLPQSDSGLCCGHMSQPNGDGTVTCMMQ